MVDEQKLSAYLQRRELTRGIPDDPREFVDDMVQDGVLTYFQAEQFLLGKWRGFTIGKYKLLERVGVGGMGQVFLCEHMFMRRRVAIKVLPPAKAEQPAALGRFYREARAAGSLQHPNIVRTHDIDQDGDLHFIVMDYVEGPSLLDVVKKFGPMELNRAASYIRQVAAGLDHAFRNGIIHRDIKPGNILIDRKGVARILDMGLARFFRDHTDQLTIKYDDKIVLGTADYVAPEQVANSHSVDIRADIYALGATYYFLLAGHPPFPLGTVSQKLLWHRTKEPTPIRQVRPEVPEGVATIVSRMMAKDPKARFQTPAQVVAEMNAWVPEAVALPGLDEMPQLSPAAMEGSVEGVMDAADPSLETAPEITSKPTDAVGVTGLQAGRGPGAAADAYGTADQPMGSPRVGPFGSGPAPSPFGPPSAGCPWGSGPAPDAKGVGQQPAWGNIPQDTGDTVAANMDPTPSRTGSRTVPPPNPFGSDASDPVPQRRWGAVATVTGAAVVVALALAAVKVFG